MLDRALRDHGREIIETAKDHLVAALASAPTSGWTAAQWAETAGVLLDGANFPAVLTHHVAPVLLAEGRVILVAEEGGLPRYGAAPPPAGRARLGGGLGAAATAAPQIPLPAAPLPEEDEGIRLSPPVVSSGHGPT